MPDSRHTTRSSEDCAHFGAQTTITYRHPTAGDELRIYSETYAWVTSDQPGLRIPFTENPRVGSSILPLATM